MENKKGRILLIVGLIIGILIGACTIYFTIGNNQKDNKTTKDNNENNVEVNNDNNVKEKEDVIKEYTYDFEGKDGICISSEEAYSTKVTMKNVGINKDTFVYTKDPSYYDYEKYGNGEKSYTTIEINGKEISKNVANEMLLVKVCAYNGYIIYELGWEGSYYVFVKDGTIITDVAGDIEDLGNNMIQVYDFSEIYKNRNGDVKSYIFNLNGDTIEKTNEISKPLNCDDFKDYRGDGQLIEDDLDRQIYYRCIDPNF